jgi:hypothetical protein
MSQAPHDEPQVSHTGFGPGTLLLLDFFPTIFTCCLIADRQYPPIPAHDQGSRGESGFVDSSGPIFSMYLGMAEEEDNKMAESWKADAEGILVFVRIYPLLPYFNPTYLS